ncbi:Putative peptidoglycan binding domain-containing protein [Gracilibacillus ureilyticus]|uniref:Putative peptidoglycan binding domain-containing protein n=1 Tax=Gracilibacillus ureilyticus TaxID=531814 RepID=A0A1H9P2X3_9BACI|nr:peptidoglycan-binding protein [Gracilibacillus ureilyticus]SER42471.1 Putative peptidoglycan binding domain-containing protein [Gracilibacillus ureilyticus]
MADFKGYRITSSYGFRTHPIRGTREFHAGIDLVKQHRAPIYAFTSGIVIYAGFGNNGTGLGGYGNVVLMKDKNNRGQLYAHLDRVAVSRGQSVGRNQIIGYQGSTGNVTGSHLHYEVRKFSETAAPYGYRPNKQTSTLNPVTYLSQFDTTESVSNSLILKRGSRGKEVLRLQQDLIKLGYSLTKYGADGIYGDETVSAVKRFQRDKGLGVDGIVGPRTRNSWLAAIRLISKYPGKYIKKGSTGELVKIIQRKLAINVDGIFGPQTEQAVKQFQRRNSLGVDGIVGSKTWRAMF